VSRFRAAESVSGFKTQQIFHKLKYAIINYGKALDKNLEIDKKIIMEEVEKAGYEVERIILFGSRARGDYKEGSDWDFFVVIDKNIFKEDMKMILRNIRRRMAVNNISNDIVIKSKDIYKNQKNDTGFLSYYVNKEGVNI
jgi:Nucleotidyltransferase domain.